LYRCGVEFRECIVPDCIFFILSSHIHVLTKIKLLLVAEEIVLDVIFVFILGFFSLSLDWFIDDDSSGLSLSLRRRSP
jgi:hypothetical protein